MGALKHSYTPRSTISKEESKALKELREDEIRVIFTADKGVALVVMDKFEYIGKAQVLLEDKKTYQEIKYDPTNKYKTRLINLLKKIKAEGGINYTLYKQDLPNRRTAPTIYGLPKIHKRGIHLRPLALDRGTTTYEAAKELARVLRPLVGSSPYDIRNTNDFVDQIHGIHLEEGECVSLYDVSALFTSMPTDSAINIIKRKLEQDQEPHLRTSMTVEQTISLLEFFLKTTYGLLSAP